MKKCDVSATQQDFSCLFKKKGIRACAISKAVMNEETKPIWI